MLFPVQFFSLFRSAVSPPHPFLNTNIELFETLNVLAVYQKILAIYLAEILALWKTGGTTFCKTLRHALN